MGIFLKSSLFVMASAAVIGDNGPLMVVSAVLSLVTKVWICLNSNMVDGGIGGVSHRQMSGLTPYGELLFGFGRLRIGWLVVR